MKRFVRIALLAFIVPACIVPVGVFAQADLQPVAIVKLAKTEPITVRQYRSELAKMEAQAKRALTDEEKRQVLDLMIDERLVLQAADRDRITVTENEVSQNVQQMRLMMSQQLGREMTQAEFESALKSEGGIDFATYKEGIRKQLIAQKYLMTKKRADFEAMKAPSAEEIQTAYELNQTKLVRPHTVKASMILVPPDGSADGQQKARALSEKLAAEIGKDPAVFDQVALRARTPDSGYQADTGAIVPRIPEVYDMFGSSFVTKLFALRIDEVSTVVETPRGFVIAKPIEIYGQKLLSLDDPYQPGGRATVREYLGNQLLQKKQSAVLEKATRDLLDELRKGTPYQIFEKNLSL